MTDRDPAPPERHDPPASPAGSRLRGALSIAAEGLIALAATLLCFGLFLWVLDAAFPDSVGLRRELRSTARRDGPQRWGLETVPGERRPTAAVLKVVSNVVRHRQPDQIAWTAARQGGTVRDGDAIQTTRDGQAMLRFADGSNLHLGRNSLLVVRGREGGSGPSYQVPQGELWGTLPAAAVNDGEVSVNTPSAVVTVSPAAGGAGKTDFKVSVGPDQSSIVAIYRGSASVTTGNQTQRVSANHFIAVDSSGAQSRPERLPDAPRMLGPEAGARFTYRDAPPQLVFRWTPVADAEEYRLVVARDATFESLVLDRRLREPQLEFGRLEAGRYLWRVTTLREGAESQAPRAAALEIVRDGAAPRLTVAFPEEEVRGDEFTVTGLSEAGSRVFVAGQPATVGPDGSFTCRIRLKRGLNLVVVETLDAAGNAAYSSGILEARY